MTQTNNLNSQELLHQIQSLQTQNLLLKAKLNSLTEGGGIKIFFSDKDRAKQIIYQVKPRLLKPLPSYSLNPSNSFNLILEGDNLQALASLAKYRHKIDLILTDPPYNTGKDFRYNDRWDQDPNDEGIGNLIKADDPSRHTKWMKFMLPRLIVMRTMLKDAGVLAICIDEHELFNLGKLLDEVFGSENRIAIINWEKATAKNDAKHVSNTTEYVLVYAKDKLLSKTKVLPRPSQLDKLYKNPDQDPKGAWIADNPTAKTPSFKSVYAIQSPFTGKLIFPASGRAWSWKKSKMKRWLEEYGSSYEEIDLKDNKASALILKGAKNHNSLENNPITKKAQELAQKRLSQGNWPRLIFSKQGQGRPGIKRYLSQVKSGVVPTTYWKKEELASQAFFWKSTQSGLTQHGTRELVQRVKQKFIGVKPLKLFLKILQIWCPPNGLVLDPFAGTGTTAEAILQLNHLTETNRSFILIEKGNPKNSDNFCRTLLVPRLKSVITGHWADKKPHDPLPSSFHYLKLTKQIDSQSILKMERDELIDTIFSTHLDATLLPNNTYLIAKNSQNEGIYLIWELNGQKRQSNVTEKVYRQCSLERKKHNLKPIYHIYARTMAYASSTIKFNKIPDHLLLEFGISLDESLKGKKK